MDYEKLAYQAGLENALKFNGKATTAAVIGVLLQAYPELKKDMKTVSQKVNSIVQEINSLSSIQQQEKLSSYGKRNPIRI